MVSSLPPPTLVLHLALSPLLKKETGGPPGDLWPSEVSIHRIPRCQSSEPLLRVSGFVHIHVAPGHCSAPYIPAIQPTGSVSVLLPSRARICRANKRWLFGDVTEELIDHCWVNKCNGFLVFACVWFVFFVSFLVTIINFYCIFRGWHLKTLNLL